MGFSELTFNTSTGRCFEFGPHPLRHRGTIPLLQRSQRSIQDYLAKEESTAGAHGVETRYPFLDRSLVQEFLWLSADSRRSGAHSSWDLMGLQESVSTWAVPIERSVSRWVFLQPLGCPSPAMFTGADGSLQNQKVPETYAFWK